jgi:fumarate hydratase class I
MTFQFQDLFPLVGDTTPYRKLTGEGVRAEKFNGQEIVAVEREAIRALSEQAFIDINHLLRPGHLAQLARILDRLRGDLER